MPNSAHRFTVTYGRQIADEDPSVIKSINVSAETSAHAAWLGCLHVMVIEPDQDLVLVDVVQLS
jgi:hypothetical protein